LNPSPIAKDKVMKTPITYYGGKQQLADDIISMMPPHKIYCEPFFGGGAVFFAKGPSFLEVINDKNDLLITFYKQCVENFERLQEKIQNTLHSESEYNKAKRIYNNPKHQSKLNIAWAVWVITNMSIMSTPRGGWKRDTPTSGSHMGSTMASYRNNFTTLVCDRLKKCQISCRDAIAVIKERDTSDTFFYLDPPYIHCDQKHYKGYSEQNFEELLQILTGVKGKFILSNFQSDLLNQYIDANGWFVKSYNRKCMIPALGSQPRSKQELLVSNYQPYPSLFDKQE